MIATPDVHSSIYFIHSSLDKIHLIYFKKFGPNSFTKSIHLLYYNIDNNHS